MNICSTYIFEFIYVINASYCTSNRKKKMRNRNLENLLEKKIIALQYKTLAHLYRIA